VGFHHQPDLSPFLQELSGRRAKAKPSPDLKRRFFFVSRAVRHEGRQGRFFCDNHKRPRPVPGSSCPGRSDQRPAGAEKPPLYRGPADQSAALLALRNC
jgi:hypothetical protein